MVFRIQTWPDPMWHTVIRNFAFNFATKSRRSKVQNRLRIHVRRSPVDICFRPKFRDLKYALTFCMPSPFVHKSFNDNLLLLQSKKSIASLIIVSAWISSFTKFPGPYDQLLSGCCSSSEKCPTSTSTGWVLETDSWSWLRYLFDLIEIVHSW